MTRAFANGITSTAIQIYRNIKSEPGIYYKFQTHRKTAKRVQPEILGMRKRSSFIRDVEAFNSHDASIVSTASASILQLKYK